MTFAPSPFQAKAIRDIKDWFTNPMQQQVFRVFGYAGTPVTKRKEGSTAQSMSTTTVSAAQPRTAPAGFIPRPPAPCAPS